MRLLRLIRVLPLWAALAAWLTFAAATLVLPGCRYRGGWAEGCRFLGQDISNAVYQLGMAAPLLLAAAVPWIAVMSLVIALVEPRRT